MVNIFSIYFKLAMLVALIATASYFSQTLIKDALKSAGLILENGGEYELSGTLQRRGNELSNNVFNWSNDLADVMPAAGQMRLLLTESTAFITNQKTTTGEKVETVVELIEKTKTDISAKLKGEVDESLLLN